MNLLGKYRKVQKNFNRIRKITKIDKDGGKVL